MKKLIIIATVVFVLLLGCAPTPVSPSPAPPGPGLAPTKIEKPSSEVQWQQAVSDAKKEGKLIVTTTSSGEVRNDLTKAFTEKYGIEIEWVTGPANDLDQKVIKERAAGLYLADVQLRGATNLAITLKRAGFLEPLEPMLILPEVTDPSVWWEGKLPFIDKDGYVAAVVCYVQSLVFINTDLVKPAELQSYQDMLNPKWKGKILMADPTIPSAAFAWAQMIGLRMMGADYLRRLVDQELTVMRDERQLAEWLARGKNPILVGIKPDPIAELQGLGAPVKEIQASEGGFLSTGPGNIAVMNKAVHPNASKVFLNWILSKEGQFIYSKANLTQSARVDVPTDHLNPFTLRAPGKKYLLRDTEDILSKGQDDLNILKEIFAKALK